MLREKILLPLWVLGKQKVLQEMNKYTLLLKLISYQVLMTIPIDLFSPKTN